MMGLTALQVGRVLGTFDRQALAGASGCAVPLAPQLSTPAHMRQRNNPPASAKVPSAACCRSSLVPQRDRPSHTSALGAQLGLHACLGTLCIAIQVFCRTEAPSHQDKGKDERVWDPPSLKEAQALWLEASIHAHAVRSVSA